MSKKTDKKDNRIKNANKFFQLLITDSESAITFVINVSLFNIDINYVRELINKSSHSTSEKENFREILQMLIEKEFMVTMELYVAELIEENEDESLQSRKENIIEELRIINRNLMQIVDNELLYWFFMSMSSTLEKELRYIEKLSEATNNQGVAKTTNILPEKMLWRGSQQDLVALYDELLKLGLILPVRNKDQLLKKHFQILDENTKEPKELGELKHSRKQLNEGYAKPTEKMKAILKKLNDDKVDNK